MKTSNKADFKRDYQIHLKHLKLKGLQPSTIDAYARAIRRIGAHFDYRLDDYYERYLSERQTTPSPKPASKKIVVSWLMLRQRR